MMGTRMPAGNRSLLAGDFAHEFASIAGLDDAIGATLAGREPAETGARPAVAAPMRVTAEDVVTFLHEQEQLVRRLREAARAIHREVEAVLA